MSTLNQSAPPPPVSKNDRVKLDPFPKKGGFVTTVVGFNYIPEYEFDRKDQTTGKEYTQLAPAIEIYIGAMIAGKAYFAKTWPQIYSSNEKSNYFKWYEASTGKRLTPVSNPADMLGGAVLATIELSDLKRKDGSTYSVSKIKSFMAVPEALAASVSPIEQLKPAFDAALAKSGDKADESTPF